ncbi:melatonin receptor type 1B-B-like [Amphiura filiformis]|uniref:melatonin receptor type 1B-B-like n=1 Tax=Amphiura filiformis TaxID=82378 RepID=UPI003B20C09F
MISEGIQSTPFSPWADDYGINTFFLVCTILMLFVGTVGNILVIGSVFVHKKLRNLGNIFIANLATADLCVSAFINSFGIVGLITKGWYFYYHSALCTAIGVICITSCSCSMWSIASISVNRYICICHRFFYPSVYNKKTVIFMIAGLWTTCFLIDLPNLLGWGDHGFDPKIMLCTYDYTKAYSYTFFFIVTGFGIPLAAITFSYTNILKFAMATKRELRNITNKDDDKKTRVIDSSDLRLLKSILTILVVFLIMWSPYAIIVVFDKNATWSRGVYVVAVILAHLNSSINSILYAATNKNFREGYWHLLSMFFCSCCRICRTRQTGDYKSKSDSLATIETSVSNVALNQR